MSSAHNSQGFVVVMLLIWLWYYFKRVDKAPVKCFSPSKRTHTWSLKKSMWVSLLKTNIELSHGQSSTLRHMNITCKQNPLCPGHWQYLQPQILIMREITRGHLAWINQPPTRTLRAHRTFWRSHHKVLFASESQQKSIIYPINMLLRSHWLQRQTL